MHLLSLTRHTLILIQIVRLEAESASDYLPLFQQDFHRIQVAKMLKLCRNNRNNIAHLITQ